MAPGRPLPPWPQSLTRCPSLSPLAAVIWRHCSHVLSRIQWQLQYLAVCLRLYQLEFWWVPLTQYMENLASLTVLSVPTHERGCLSIYFKPLYSLLAMFCSFQCRSPTRLLLTLFLSISVLTDAVVNGIVFGSSSEFSLVTYRSIGGVCTLLLHPITSLNLLGSFHSFCGFLRIFYIQKQVIWE